MELLERDGPRTRIDEAFRRVYAGEGVIVLVSGEAGIGKTAFVTEFTGAQHPGTRVLWGACDPLFTPRPLGPIYDIAMRDLPQLGDLLDSGADWFAIAAALQKFLVERQAATILVFEDIHWADEATLDLIKYLGRRVQQAKTLFILTYREDEPGVKHTLAPVLGNLPSQHVTHLHLKPLSQEAVETIARKMNRSPRGVYEATGGNPFFVTEVLRSKGSSDLAAGRFPAAGSFPAAGIPATVRDAVLARARYLDEAARELLELASIFPGQAELWLLETILQPEPGALDACLESGFLLTAGEALTFRHELARLAIEESLPPGRAETLHRKALEALREHVAAEPSLARLVHHAMRGAQAEQILEYGPRAAEQASRQGAHREAVRYYQAALRYLHLIPKGEQARILDKLSFEYYLTGQIETAIQVRHQAIDLWREGEQPKQVGDDLRWLSRLYWFFGNKAMADHYAQEAIAVLEPLQPGKELAMVYSNRSQLHMLSEDIEGTFDWGKKALDLAESLGETEIIIHALTNIGSAEMTNGGESGRIKLEQALRLAEANEMHDHAARCYAGLISRTVENWNYPAAERYLEAGLTYTTDRDTDSYSIYFRGWRARWFFEQGRWAEATTCVEEVLQLHPGSAVIALPAVTTLGHVEVRQGHSDAMRLLDQARELALGTSEFQRITPVSVARAEAAWWNDQPQRVLEEIQPAEALSNRTRGAYSLGAIAYWIWRAGGEVRWESEIPTAYRAMITGDLRNAADEWGRIGCPYEQALALAEGDLEAQRTALAIFDRLGARPARRWLREKMLSEGLKRVPRGVRASTRNNPEGLTDRELNILALLEQGLSNAEIAKQLTISPKTVDHHVSAILAKLQVHSRLEAAALARQKNIH